MQKNQIVDLEITDLSYEAMGVAHLDGGPTLFQVRLFLPNF